MLLADAIENASVFWILIGFSVWAPATVGVLMGMDVMECCLHTLRLHWVEYQSKFYKGDGHKYNEFSFKEVTHSAES